MTDFQKTITDSLFALVDLHTENATADEKRILNLIIATGNLIEIFDGTQNLFSSDVEDGEFLRIHPMTAKDIASFFQSCVIQLTNNENS